MTERKVRLDDNEKVPRLTREQAAIIGCYTGITASNFSIVHEKAEKVLGRPVWTHQFASEELNKELREKIKPEFLAIVYEGE
jgi:hypothetical protein